MVVSRTEEMQARITLEESVKQKLRSAFANEQLMDDVRHSQKEEAAGIEGISWTELKKELGLE